MAQLVRAPPCHGGGREFESLLGRCGVLAQLGEHLPYKQRVIGSSPIGPTQNGWVPEWPKGADCKSVASCFGGSNPPPSICRQAYADNKFVEFADVAQLAEQLICNQQVIGSSPIIGFYSIKK